MEGILSYSISLHLLIKPFNYIKCEHANKKYV
jgi:hypothetical protein